ncbi:hypothetical protein GMA11_05060 [Granulicatella sp. zg-ZJ]|uniref:glycosyltransferase family 4 protein n=1 Tax=Granulicatella sp. zg-ZJ TaxID=2678504 RepID=UPI0013D43247|nr:glycosyltransferase family 4 protein [Granulicatella sp. zg-ZJ]NEW62757.1 hypothetical protein [Granulicatella sp. zg-ZJ]
MSNFNYYGLRIQYIQTYLEQKGYDVTYVTGDYDTMNRQKYTLAIPNIVQIPLIQYKKNISFERIHSHYAFAKKVYQQLEMIRPDVIYAMVPPNFVAHFIAKYKKKYPSVRVIFDVFDMWPETFPSGSSKTLLSLPFYCWQTLRTKALSKADYVFSECDLFKERLKEIQPTLNVQTLYPCKENCDEDIAYTPEEDVLPLCYLGSINNIIDIDKIEEMIKVLSEYKPITLHVIGNGEKKEQFIERLSVFCQHIYDYGNVYDAKKKQDIFNQCAFGINILKPTVFIGLTLKTLDYLNGGLPLLNTVSGDTERFVFEYSIGKNIKKENIDNIQSLTSDDILQMKYRAKDVFMHYFNQREYNQRLDELLGGVFTKENDR